MSSRHDDIAALYGDKACDLERAIDRAITGPRELIEDACSHAWTQLLTHPHVHLDERGFGWLYVVAWREAVRLGDRARREPALGEPSELPLPTAPKPNDPAIVIQRLIEDRVRLGLLGQLSERQREMVALHAAGFSYREIQQLCDVTLRTVERQLLRGKRALRRLDQEHAATRRPA